MGWAGVFDDPYKAGLRRTLRALGEPLPAAWAPALRAGGDAGARQRHERVFIHVLKMLAMALNARFHARMRDALGPHVVAGEGVMQKGRDGAWRLTPEKGVARMEGKRVSDHVTAPG